MSERLYEDLRDYLEGGGAGAGYNDMYTRKNKYGGLNKFAKGNRQGINASFTLNISRVHTFVYHHDDFDFVYLSHLYHSVQVY